MHLYDISELFVADHPDTLASLDNLASTYWNQNRWEEAEELQAKELEICTRMLSPRHPRHADQHEQSRFYLERQHMSIDSISCW